MAGRAKLYSPLEANQIRLLQILPTHEGNAIHCTLETTILGTKDYIALSYTWGKAEEAIFVESDEDNESDEYEVTVNECTITVTQNLFHFLQDSFRASAFDSLLWIDAICINQDDDHEKASQVNLMGEIYRSAQHVLVWLGKANSKTSKVQQMIDDLAHTARSWEGQDSSANRPGLHDLSDPKTMSSLGLTDVTEDDWLALLLFFQRRWWMRAWTFQEIVLSRQAVFHCGVYHFNWDDMVDVGQLVSTLRLNMALTELGQRRCGREYQLYNMWSSRLTFTSLVAQIADGKEKPKEFYDQIELWFNSENVYSNPVPLLMSFARNLRSSGAADPRDKIFALCGLTSIIARDYKLPPLQFAADYSKNVVEVYTEFMAQLLQSIGSLKMLNEPQVLEEANMPGLPSWVIDFSISRPNDYLTDRTKNDANPYGAFNASNGKSLGFSIEGHCLRLHRMVLGKVVAIGDTLGDISRLDFDFAKTTAIALHCIGDRPDIVDSIWKVMVFFNMNGRSSQADEDRMRRAFHSFLLESCLAKMTMLRRDQGATYLEALDSVSDLMRLGSLDTTGSVPDQRAILELHEKVRWVPGKVGLVEDDLYDELFPEIELWGMRTKSTLHRRRTFLLDTGYLGLGPESIVIGDELCAVADGARTPLFFHPLETADGYPSGNYRLIGEAYVHGMMYGEGVERMEEQGHKWEEIDVV